MRPPHQTLAHKCSLLEMISFYQLSVLRFAAICFIGLSSGSLTLSKRLDSFCSCVLTRITNIHIFCLSWDSSISSSRLSYYFYHMGVVLVVILISFGALKFILLTWVRTCSFILQRLRSMNSKWIFSTSFICACAFIYTL